jgi:hypothetical protein
MKDKNYWWILDYWENILVSGGSCIIHLQSNFNIQQSAPNWGDRNRNVNIWGIIKFINQNKK